MTKNILFLRFTNIGGTFTMTANKPIPQQTMILKSFRSEFDTAPHALACKFLKFCTPWLGGSAIQSGICNGDATYTFYSNKGLVIELDNAVVTRGENMDLAVDMSQEAPLTFDFNIFGIALTGFVESSFQFEYDINAV